MRLRPIRRGAVPAGSPVRPAGRAWLVLALAVIAIVPVALAGLVGLAIAGPTTPGESARVSARAEAQLEAARIGSRLGATAVGIRLLAAERDVVRFVDSRGRTARADGRAALLAGLRALGDVPRRLSVYDAKGVELLRIVDGRPVAPDTTTSAEDAALASSARVVTDETPIVALGPATSGGSVPVRMAYPVRGRSSGTILIDMPIGTAFSLVPTSGGSGDLPRVPVPGTRGLSIVTPPADAGFAPSMPPISLLGLGGALILAGLLAVWIVRRQVQPTRELARSQETLRRAYEAARNDSLVDSLTGLGNQRAYMDELARHVEGAQRHGSSVSLLLIDVDDLKVVNDAAGHAAGDELLAAMGSRLARSIRRADRAFRIGGDEFAVIMPQTEAAGAEVLGRRLLRSVLEPFPGDRFGRPFSFSGGISTCPILAGDQHQLAAQADGALYWSKRHGRTAVTIFDPARHRSKRTSDGLAELSSFVVRLVEQRAISVVYQPIVDLINGTVLGFEGLVRPATGSGFENAGVLFSAAEESGRTVELDRICLEAVVAGAAKLHPETYVSLNVSPRTVEAPEFSPAAFLRLLARHRIAPDRVIMELTEREEVENVARLRSNLATCQAAGVRVAADDVGSGNAGLRLLSQVHFDLVKVDLTLVQGGVSQAAAADVVTTLRELASRWGATVVAEGIETAEELRFVRRLGITAGQGYLLGRPTENPTQERVDLQAVLADVDWLDRVVAAGRAARPAVPVSTRAT